MSYYSNHEIEVLDEVNADERPVRRPLSARLIAEARKPAIRGYTVTWLSAHWKNGLYTSEVFTREADAKNYATWLKGRTGTMAATAIRINPVS